MKITIIRASVFEDKEVTTARFLNDLNRDIANVVELLYYLETEDMMHMTIKMKKNNWKEKVMQDQIIIWDPFRIKSQILG